MQFLFAIQVWLRTTSLCGFLGAMRQKTLLSTRGYWSLWEFHQWLLSSQQKHLSIFAQTWLAYLVYTKFDETSYSCQSSCEAYNGCLAFSCDTCGFILKELTLVSFYRHFSIFDICCTGSYGFGCACFLPIKDFASVGKLTHGLFYTCVLDSLSFIVWGFCSYV